MLIFFIIFFRAPGNRVPFPPQGQNVFGLPWLAACLYGIQVSGVQHGFHMIRLNYLGIIDDLTVHGTLWSIVIYARQVF